MIRATSFPSSYVGISTNHLLEAYGRGPAQLASAIRHLDEGALRTRCIAGKWTIQGIVFHVTDSELIEAVRIRQVLSQSDRSFAHYDQVAWARELDYNNRERNTPARAIELFSLLRSTTGALLAAATEGDWRKSGLHAELGEVTLRQLLELYADQGERHMAQIDERRDLLGRPIQLPLLLAERLN